MKVLTLSILTALTACVTKEEKPLAHESYSTPGVYQLPQGEVLECKTADVDDCGWHLRGCGTDLKNNFDCIEGVKKIDPEAIKAAAAKNPPAKQLGVKAPKDDAAPPPATDDKVMKDPTKPFSVDAPD